jgi:phosphatidylethanolamine/phosphatidyl-N-methylethanolamine N-methyltransferase
MISGTCLEKARAVVELGPGTGAITQSIVSSISRDASFLALEVDAAAVRRLRRRFPDRNIYEASAETIGTYLRRHRLHQADVVVCSIPWAVTPEDLQRRIMGQVAAALAPDGVFTAYTYIGAARTPRGRHYGHLLRELFRTVEVSKVVWRNVPPALIYRCRDPRRQPDERTG